MGSLDDKFDEKSLELQKEFVLRFEKCKERNDIYWQRFIHENTFALDNLFNMALMMTRPDTASFSYVDLLYANGFTKQAERSKLSSPTYTQRLEWIREVEQSDWYLLRVRGDEKSEPDKTLDVADIKKHDFRDDLIMLPNEEVLELNQIYHFAEHGVGIVLKDSLENEFEIGLAHGAKYLVSNHLDNYCTISEKQKVDFIEESRKHRLQEILMSEE